MNQRQLASTILIAGTMNVLVSLVLLFGGGAGGHSIEGVDGKKVLITYDQDIKTNLVVAKQDWFDSSDFKTWLETKVDKPVNGDPNYKILPVGLTIDSDMPQWKTLTAIVAANSKTKNTLTVTSGGYYRTWDLPPDEATAKALIEQVLH